MALLKIRPVLTAGGAVRRYMPVVVGMRALAVVRTMLVGRLLAEAGKSQFGAYNQGLELVNWILPLVVLGMDSVAERYVAVFEAQGELKSFLLKQSRRLLLSAGLAAGIIAAASPWIAALLMQDRRWWLLILLAGLQLAALVINVWTGAVLRGLRAYGAAAATEVAAALLLLVLSCGAAYLGRAEYLMIAYLIATLIPLVLAWSAIMEHIRAHPGGAITQVPGIGSFGRWNVLRGFLVMTFGALAINGVRFHGGSEIQLGEFSMVYRIAQVLAYIGVTFWASTYTVAARRWSVGSRKRAMYEQLQIGKVGVLGLFIMGLAVVSARPLVVLLQPAYAVAIDRYLAGLIGVFIWYGIMGWLSVVGDVREKPAFGTLIWLVAVGVQVVMLAVGGVWIADPLTANLIGCGLGVALGAAAGLIVMSLYGWGRQTLWPVAGVAVATLAFVGPPGIAHYLAAVVGVVLIIMLGLGEVLLRPYETRTIFRFWKGGRAG